MTNIDYISHGLFDPTYYHREYDHDLIEDSSDPTYIEDAKRYATIALPFVSLYKPMGSLISIGMGSIRCFSHLNLTITAEDTTSFCKEGFYTVLAITALASSLYQFTFGLYITSMVDILTNVADSASYLYQGDMYALSQEILSLCNNSMYLAIMMTGSLEIVLASLLLQAVYQFVEARKEYNEDRVLESVAKALMGVIRLYQANGQVASIGQRNAYLLNAKYESFIKSIQNGRDITELKDHPLSSLQKEISKNNVTFSDGEKAYDYGANFFGFGKGAVKGMNINFQEKIVKGKPVTELDFKVNHAYREKIEKTLNDLASLSKSEASDLLSLFGSHATSLSTSITTLPSSVVGANIPVYQIHLEGLGDIYFGRDNELYNKYDRIYVHLDANKSFYDFYETLSICGLGDVLQISMQEDIERMKIGQLYRMLCPGDATLFERTDEFFTLNIDELKSAIIKRTPKMEEHFLTYLPRMSLREYMPGKFRFGIDGLSKELKEKGALGFTASIMGAWENSELFERVSSIFSMGMLSSETKQKLHMNKQGLSAGMDEYTGGSDSVFTQLVTKSCEEVDDLAYFYKVQIIFDTKIAEMGTYQYHDDNYGFRGTEDLGWWWKKEEYLERENILDFVASERVNFNYDNEVMSKEYISTDYIKGVVVDSEKTKKGLINHLRFNNQIQKDENGQETILGIALSDFFHTQDESPQDIFA